MPWHGSRPANLAGIGPSSPRPASRAILLPSRQLARSTTFDPRDETIFFAILSATEPIVCFRSLSLAGLPRPRGNIAARASHGDDGTVHWAQGGLTASAAVSLGWTLTGVSVANRIGVLTLAMSRGVADRDRYDYRHHGSDERHGHEEPNPDTGPSGPAPGTAHLPCARHPEILVRRHRRRARRPGTVTRVA